MRRNRPWATYEQQVFDLFKAHSPKAEVRQNVRVRGQFSKRTRQIDILIVENTPAGQIRTVIDTKLFKRKVNVKSVDALAGFIEDVDAHRGMLITNKGYSPAALRRAYYGPSDLELDILSFSELERFQSFVAIPYVGDKAFLIRAPLGWVVDAARPEGLLAIMYQRGLDASAARAKKEFLYVQYWDRKVDPLTAAQLDELQVERMKVLLGPVTVSHRPTVHRDDAGTRLRIADVKRYRCLEATGFLEFKDVIFFAVLLTPIETQGPNIRRLESVMQQALRIELRRDNTLLIAKARQALSESPIDSERTRLLREIGHWYRDMNQLDEARHALEESLSLAASGHEKYWTAKELLPVLSELGDKGASLTLTSRLLRLDPRNPTVFNDAISTGRHHISRAEMLGLIEALKKERPEDELVQGNCDYYAGILLADVEPARARERLLAARRIFRRTRGTKDQVFSALRIMLQQCGSVQTERQPDGNM
jgi:tetratricopeptide (TPR) repeat protein